MMEYNLEDVFDLQMGKTPSRDRADYWNTNDFKWISIADLTKSDKFISETKEYLSDVAVKESGISLIPSGTVIMSFKLSIGKAAITTEPMYSNEAIMAFKDKHVIQLLPDYVYYMLTGKNWDECANKAVKGKTLNKATLSKIKVNIHDLPKQREIVAVLDKTKSLIDKRNRELKQLDNLIKARFVEMFGDPVSNSLNQPILAMTDVCEIIDGDRGVNYPKQEDFYNDEYCLFLNAKNVTKKGFDFSECMFITKEKDEQLRKGKLKRGDVVLTTRGTLGNIAFYTKDIPFDNVRINSGMVILRLNRDIIDETFFIEQFRMQVDSIKTFVASGSAQPQLPISTMNKIKVLMPDLELQKQYSQIIEQIDKSKFSVMKGNALFM